MFYELLRRLLFTLPPEASHRVALGALGFAEMVRMPLGGGPLPGNRAVECLGLKFPNVVGLAAGFDKNGDHVNALGALGFGFIEIGTLTPRPQAGNPKPRLYRLPEASALINQMGSPNRGLEHAVEALKRRTYRGIVGVNIGKNADTPLEHAAEDYVLGYRAMSPYADYLAVNISSPNTQGLRELQAASHLRRILESLSEERDKAPQSRPVLIKLSPDLSDDELDSIAGLIVETGSDGVIATNSTTSRAGLVLDDARKMRGGLSGRPLHEKSLHVIRRLRARLGRSIGIMGVGGILSADDALETLEAGANLVQIYSGFVYRGPRLIAEILDAVR